MNWKHFMRFVCLIGVAVAVLVACGQRGLEGRWRSDEYEASMKKRFTLLIEDLEASGIEFQDKDYVKSGQAAIVIKGDKVAYETKLVVDLDRFAEDVYAQTTDYYDSPDDIIDAYLNSTTDMTYDEKTDTLKQTIFTGRLDQKKQKIILEEVNHRGLKGVETMTYKVKGKTLTITGNGYTHEFIRE